MKLRPKSNQGQVLVAALVIGLVLGLSLMAYLSWASTQNRLIMRSQSWNSALTLVEAGLEEALTHLKYVDTNLNQHGWTLSGSRYAKSRALGEERYTVEIEDRRNPNIISEGFVPAPLGGDSMISRKVLVSTTNNPVFHSAFVADQRIDLNGNKLRIDSFDSADPNASTGGKYDITKAKDNGDVAINQGIVDGLDVGNAEIYGKVYTGPGGSVSIGSKGAVGSTAWHNAGKTGLEPGWSGNDFNQPLEPVPGPTVGLPPVGGLVGTVNYSYILSSGTWRVSQLSGSVLVTGNATLIVDDTVDITGTDSIVIAPTASLNLYAYGGTVKLGGAGVSNQSNDASRFALYGGAKTSDIILNGSVNFNGVIYAPSADIKIGGGGGADINFVGAGVGKSITLIGHVNAHYDESLKNKFFRGYVITSWTEL